MYETKIQRLDFIIEKLKGLTPSNLCKKEHDKLVNIYDKLNRIMSNNISISNLKVNNIINKLELLNPISTLKRGYSVTYKEGNAITDVNNLNEGDSLLIRLYNGEVESKVISTKEVK